MKKSLDGFVPVLPGLRSFGVYRKALEAAGIVEDVKITGDLRDHRGRASRSVVLNIAEGSGQLTLAGKRRRWSITRGSLREVAACVDLAALSLGACAELVCLAGLLVECDRMLRKLLG